MSKEPLIGFHEASVVDVRSADRNITLSLEGVRMEGAVFPATVLLNGIRSLGMEWKSTT
jgi:hypothetical protein